MLHRGLRISWGNASGVVREGLADVGGYVHAVLSRGLIVNMCSTRSRDAVLCLAGPYVVDIAVRVLWVFVPV